MVRSTIWARLSRSGPGRSLSALTVKAPRRLPDSRWGCCGGGLPRDAGFDDPGVGGADLPLLLLFGFKDRGLAEEGASVAFLGV
jgi:hypothetical protein